ncbi:hypothetical protein BpHYR1_024442 [Brachionus plicatilis]|uniref:Endonuclease/exonuclease/phosphatase domain-containing protein n=1 Tax=Brachionus plicatilis TaxID=10195 RepID=A0A3M7SAP9_BRAPC|nr:hypothetical protein BpHYR1_024442 [Brachionus plicatilis]
MEGQSHTLKIASINVGGIKNNIEYLNALTLTHNIVCIQETWAMNKSAIEQNLYCFIKTVYFKPARKFSKTGGTVRFCSYRVGFLDYGEISLINVYLPFFDGSLDNKFEFDQEMEIIQDLFDQRIGRKIYIMGDMNTDIAKTNHNTFSLLRFLKKNNLTLLDVKQTQTTDFTYRKIINNKCITSWIDHVITDQSMDDEITCRILESDLNLGDHQAISTTLEEVEKIEEVKPEHLKIDRPKIKYQNHHQRRMYQQELEKLLHKEPFYSMS